MLSAEGLWFENVDEFVLGYLPIAMHVFVLSDLPIAMHVFVLSDLPIVMHVFC